MIFSKIEIIDGEQYVKIDLLEKEIKENRQLQNNWNELKEWLEEYIETNEKWYSSELSNHDK